MFKMSPEDIIVELVFLYMDFSMATVLGICGLSNIPNGGNGEGPTHTTEKSLIMAVS